MRSLNITKKKPNRVLLIKWNITYVLKLLKYNTVSLWLTFNWKTIFNHSKNIFLFHFSLGHQSLFNKPSSYALFVNPHRRSSENINYSVLYLIICWRSNDYKSSKAVPVSLVGSKTLWADVSEQHRVQQTECFHKKRIRREHHVWSLKTWSTSC